jgi:hypothetical protein
LSGEGQIVVRNLVRRIAGQREFRQEDDCGAEAGRALDAVVQFGAKSRGVAVPTVLDDADPQCGTRGRHCPGQGGGRIEAGDFNHDDYSRETIVTK